MAENFRINENSIAGNFLPTVYIERVTLESSPIAPPMHNLDPHIAREDRANVRFLKDNEETESMRGQKQALKVSLDLSLKQKIVNTSHLALQWLSDLDLQKYLRITVIQSTEPVATSMLSRGNVVARALVELDDAEFLSAWDAVSP